MIARGAITSSVHDVQRCAYFSGTAKLPPGTSLILVNRNASTRDKTLYSELVFHYSEPDHLAAWRGAQYFNPDAIDQEFDVLLEAVSMSAADAYHKAGNSNSGQAIAASGKVLDSVRVKRVAGDTAGGCDGD